jgi:hypothetical protein
VAEELRLHEAHRDGAAGDGEERPRTPVARVMDGARDERRAGAGLPGDRTSWSGADARQRYGQPEIESRSAGASVESWA